MHDFCWLLIFFLQNLLFHKTLSQILQGVKQFGSRLGSMFCRACSQSKRFAKVISRQHYLAEMKRCPEHFMVRIYENNQLFYLKYLKLSFIIYILMHLLL